MEKPWEESRVGGIPREVSRLGGIPWEGSRLGGIPWEGSKFVRVNVRLSLFLFNVSNITIGYKAWICRTFSVCEFLCMCLYVCMCVWVFDLMCVWAFHSNLYSFLSEQFEFKVDTWKWQISLYLCIYPSFQLCMAPP